MKTLIVYATKYGSTVDCAARLRDKLAGGAELHNLKTSPDVPIDSYDTIVVASPVYAGRLLKPVYPFFERYRAKLLEKPLGIFLCCGTDRLKPEKALRANIDEAFVEHAKVLGQFGGEFRKKGMSLPDRLMLWLAFLKTGLPHPDFKPEEIDKFAKRLEK